MLAGLWGLVILLVAIWLILWLAVHITSGLIHIIIVAAVLLLLYNLFVHGRFGRRS